MLVVAVLMFFIAFVVAVVFNPVIEPGKIAGIMVGSVFIGAGGTTLALSTFVRERLTSTGTVVTYLGTILGGGALLAVMVQ